MIYKIIIETVNEEDKYAGKTVYQQTVENLDIPELVTYIKRKKLNGLGALGSNVGAGVASTLRNLAQESINEQTDKIN